jgi:hypothetical protein
VPVAERREVPRTRVGGPALATPRMEPIRTSALSPELTSSTVASVGGPEVQGGLWTVPVHFRRLRRLDECLVRVVAAFSDVRLVGNPDPWARAKELVPLIGQLGAAETPSKERDIQGAVEMMKPIVDAIGDRLDSFNRAARFDLGHEGSAVPDP